MWSPGGVSLSEAGASEVNEKVNEKVLCKSRGFCGSTISQLCDCPTILTHHKMVIIIGSP